MVRGEEGSAAGLGSSGLQDCRCRRNGDSEPGGRAGPGVSPLLQLQQPYPVEVTRTGSCLSHRLVAACSLASLSQVLDIST